MGQGVDSGFGHTHDRAPTLTSVVVPCRNAGSTIGAQLDALARQDFADAWELILVDNGSTDSSIAVAESMRPNLPRLRILHASDRLGAAYARNVGARHAQGQLLAFLDADDVASSSWLSSMTAAAREWDLVAGRLSCLEFAGAPMSAESDGPRTHQEFGFPRASTSNLAVWRCWHERLGGFDESFMRTQDDDYTLRASLAGANVGYAADAIVFRRPRASAKATFRQHFGYGVGTVHLYAKHREAGLSRRSGRVALNVWAHWIGRTPAALAAPTSRARWAANMGKNAGRIAGSVRYGVWAP